MAKIFPEVADAIDQASFQAMNRALFQGRNMRIQGLNLKAGTGLAVEVQAGYAVIADCVVEFTAAETLSSLTASTTNYIFMDSAGALTKSTTPDVPTGKISLGRAVTDGSTVTSVKGPIEGAPIMKSPGLFVAVLDTAASTTLTSYGIDVTDLTMPAIPRGEIWVFYHVYKVTRDVDTTFGCDFDSNQQYCAHSSWSTVDNDGSDFGVTRTGAQTGAGYYMGSTWPTTGAGDTTKIPIVGWNVIGFDPVSGGGTITPVPRIWSGVSGKSVTLKANSWIVGWRIS